MSLNIPDCFNFSFIKTLCNNNYILGVVVNCKAVLLEKRKINLLHVSFFLLPST